MEHLGRRIGFCVELAGLLELQGRFVGQRERRAATQTEKGLRGLQIPSQRAPVQSRCLFEDTWKRANRLQKLCVLLPFRKQPDGRHHRCHKGLRCGNALLDARVQSECMLADPREITVGVVRQRKAQRSLSASHFRHAHDVGALARLRDREACRLRQSQLARVNGGDRWADRGHRYAGHQFTGIFEIGRCVV